MENPFGKIKKVTKIATVATIGLLPIKDANAQKTNTPILDDINIGFNKYKASDVIDHPNFSIPIDYYNAKGNGLSLGLTKKLWTDNSAGHL